MSQNEAVSNKPDKEKIDTKLILKWLSPILLGVLAYVICMPFGARISIFSGLTVWSVFAWIFEILPVAITAILLVIFYIIGGVATPAQVFSPWAGSVPWLVFGGMIISLGMQKTGLAKRVAYKILSVTGGSYIGLTIGIGVIGLILTPAVTSPSARVLLLAPIIIGICEALNIKRGSKEGVFLLMAVFYAASMGGAMFQTSSEGIYIADSVKKVTGQVQTFNNYISYMTLIAIAWVFVSLFILFILRPKKLNMDKKLLVNNYCELGGISKKEIWSAILFVGMFLIFFTQKYHKIAPQWVIILVASLQFFPGINILKPEDLSKANFLILFFIASSLGIGEAATASGAGKLFAQSVTPLMHGQSPIVILLGVWVIGILSNFVLTPLAAMATFIPVLIDVFVKLGFNPYVASYTFIQGIGHVFFPFHMAPALIIYSFGYVKIKDFLKLGAIRLIVGLIFMLLIAFPYWKLIGVM